MSFITLDQAKLLLRISASNTSKDDLINYLIMLIEPELRLICNRTFKDADGNDDWPAGIEYWGAQMIGFSLTVQGGEGVTGERIGDYSYTKTNGGAMLNGWPKAIVDALEQRYGYVGTQRGNIFIEFPELRGYIYGIIPERLKAWR